MPFVRIALRAGTTPEYRKAIADGVHQTMLDSIATPSDGRSVPGNHRAQRGTQSCRTALHPDSSDQAEILKASPGLRTEDLLVSLVEVNWENWSLGNGEAQYQKD